MTRGVGSIKNLGGTGFPGNVGDGGGGGGEGRKNKFNHKSKAVEADSRMRSNESDRKN